MRELFPEFRKPSEEELKKLWVNALFVFDANILLGLYRLPRRLRTDLISKLEKLKDRVWLPHQVALEYYRTRAEVIHEQERTYQNLIRMLKDCENNSVEQLKKYDRHPFIENKKIVSKIVASYKTILNDLDKIKSKQPDWNKSDDVECALSEVFKNKIGSAYEQKKLLEIYSEGQTRYNKEIPPGYKDKEKDKDDKTGTRKFGDLIIWFQVIDKAKESKKPIIFVTAEKSEDWWCVVGGKTVGARYELKTEIKDKADVVFYMYQSDRFIEHASKYLEVKFNKDLIEEVKKLKDGAAKEEQDLVKPKEDLSISVKDLICSVDVTSAEQVTSDGNADANSNNKSLNDKGSVDNQTMQGK